MTVELAPLLTKCGTCRSPMRATINGWMKAGVPDIEIERRLRQAGQPISRISLGKHKRNHLRDEFTKQVDAAIEVRDKQARTFRPTQKDAALVVRDIGLKRIEAGDIEPTVSETLRAQEIIDRRAEKGAEFEIQLIFASILGGTPLIEGTPYRELTGGETDTEVPAVRTVLPARTPMLTG